jgi:hypothetical protein
MFYLTNCVRLFNAEVNLILQSSIGGYNPRSSPTVQTWREMCLNSHRLLCRYLPIQISNLKDKHLLFLSDGREALVIVVTQVFVGLLQNRVKVFGQIIFIQFSRINPNTK